MGVRACVCPLAEALVCCGARGGGGGFKQAVLDYNKNPKTEQHVATAGELFASSPPILLNFRHDGAALPVMQRRPVLQLPAPPINLSIYALQIMV